MFLLLACVALNAAAQGVVPTEMNGQPLQYMKDGKVIGCGIRIIAGRALGDDSFEFSEVSVNLYASGTALIKGVAYKTATISAHTPRLQ